MSASKMTIVQATNGEKFRLGEYVMEQLGEAPYLCFRGALWKATHHAHRGHADAKVSYAIGHTYGELEARVELMWNALRIGCMLFEAAEAERIITWASGGRLHLEHPSPQPTDSI